MEMYERNVKYYETDKMGIVHHSNYIRWMEEARMYVMENLGFGYDKMEKDGIISPVIEVSCKYRKMTYFNENIKIDVFLEKLTSAKFTLSYEMRNVETEELKATGTSVHCFMDGGKRPVVITREMPEFVKALETLRR